jgi:hypothetical protein
LTEKSFITGETKVQRKNRKYNEKEKKRRLKAIPESVIPRTTIENVAFILGNGKSRESINPIDLRPHGLIYGCNALFRSFAPDHLIAVDTKMIKEITNADYHTRNSVWTNPNRYTRNIPGLNLFDPSLGWSSGPSALNLASNQGNKTIYILGFDYQGMGNKQELVNNIFAGTANYKQVNDRATYFGNWSRQTCTCIKKHTEVKYIRVIEHGKSFIPDQLQGIVNLTHITVENFKKKFEL